MSAARVTLNEAAIRRVQRGLAQRGFSALGEELLATAQERTPVDTGRLRQGMWAAVYEDGSLVWSRGSVPASPAIKGQGIEVIVGNDVPYARFVHDGTSDTEQHPFLAEALAIARPRMGSIVAGGR